MLRPCAQCKQSFEVTEADLDFYDKVSPILGEKKFSLPPPTFCPDCRRHRKLAWRNERTLYQRTCDRCQQSIVSVHSPENPYPVYCNPCWRSEEWDPLSYGKEYDFDHSFFEQFIALYNTVPQRAMVNDDGVKSENCAYCFDVAYSKDCYLCIGMWKAQNCYYCRICDQSKFCVDCEGVKLGSELAYESIDCQRLYNSAYLQNSEHCFDCVFGFDLKDCSDCICCVGLRQKRFMIFNEQYTEEGFAKERKAMRLGSYSGVQKLREQFADFSLKFPRKNMNLQNCEDCLGDHLFNCRNVLGFVSTNSEHSKWIERSDGPQWCYDVVQSGSSQWGLEHITADDSYGVLFSSYCNQSRFTLYSDNCLSSENILGCVSLRRKKYCILNREYTPEEYAQLAVVILTDMQKSGDFGEFFPIRLSPYGYNETNAAEFYPLSEAEVRERGWPWRSAHPSTTGKETIQEGEIPDDIADVPGTITHEILACSDCQRNFRIVMKELEFYRKVGVPLPRMCPDCRNQSRLARRNPYALFERSCAKCAKGMWTSYPPERPEIVYCEECYLKGVY